MTGTSTRFRGEKAIAVIVTALCLIPLMAFAAFGVDLASWYSRSSYLQKSADAAALAGTVWMPNLSKSTLVACDSLEENGIVGQTGSPDCSGPGGTFEVTVDRGTTATALEVTVTDPSATRYFSRVIASGDQRLTRSAEAEYNLPIPLGSPLNYFGGDYTRTVPATPPNTYALNWPANANSSARVPAVAQVGETQQAFGCNVGTLAAQGYGRWTNATTYQPTGFSGSTRCNYAVGFTLPGGTPTNVPPPDYTRRAPTNHPCNVFQLPAGTNGRWESATTFNAGARYTSGTGNRQCTWAIAATNDVPNFANGTNIPPGSAPVNRPCRVGYEATLGWWGPTATSGFSLTGAPSGGNQSVGNRLCRWPAAITTTTPPTPPNPISSTRSPGFWAQVEGPTTISTNGDAYSTRCYTTANCGSVQNLQYKDPTDPDRGFWYVVKVPAATVGSIDINVFDASHNTNGTTFVLAGDRSFTSGSTFPTDFKVYQQTNALDFGVRTAVFPSTTGDEVDGSCNWRVNGATSTAFTGTWRRLCTITSPTPGATYLINVQTVGTTGNGVNGYALEAVTGGSHANANQPALYAYANMGMYNTNTCTPTPCTPPPATFYLAEVGPQFAGRTLVVDLWDPGDVADGNASMVPKMPSPTVPKPVQDVAPENCSYTSSPAPNPVQSGSDPTGATYSTPQPSDNPARCSITTATGGARRFNGTWVTIRIDIPVDYDCNASSPATPVNPETTADSCWWGIQYIFSESSQDVTVWQARIEGNPVHLTE